MTFAQRFALVVTAAFFLSTAAASLCAWIFTPPLLRLLARFSPSVRATALTVWRLLPAGGAVIVTACVLAPGYYRYEQRDELEGVSALVLLLAAAGAIVFAAAAVRVVRVTSRSAALRREWLASSTPLSVQAAGMPAFAIETPYPLVAVIGAFRPRLFMSSVVLRNCPPNEIAAIVQHERGHARTRDNLVRLLMEAAPDLLAGTAVSDATAAEWHRAIEHRADDRAEDRLTLASALVRVARLAGSGRHAVLPASALYRGAGVEDRVRRLLAGAADCDCGWRFGAAAAVVITAISALVIVTDFSELSHRLLEALVTMR